MDEILRIEHEGVVLALVIRSTFRSEGIVFLTGGDSSQQLGYMNRPNGYVIQPHRHLSNDRRVALTQETLLIRSGRVRIDLYDDHENYVRSLVASTGDVVLLAAGGHGLEMLEDTEIVEVKQGPYDGDKDKIRFSARPSRSEIRLSE